MSIDLSHLNADTPSLDASLICAIASGVAYEGETQVLQWSQTESFASIDFFDWSNTQGFVASTEKVVILAFRGTERNFADWIRNLKIRSVPSFVGGSVHAGFQEGLLKAWPIVTNLLRKHKADQKTIWITGHSLGGALAVLAAAYSFDSLGRNIRLVTFGQPRVSRGDLTRFIDRSFGESFWRFVNNRDIVPKIPPGFDHTGERLFFDGDGVLSRSRLQSRAGADDTALTVGEFLAFQEELESETTGLPQGSLSPAVEGRAGAASDHSIKNYIDLLGRAVDEQ